MDKVAEHHVKQEKNKQCEICMKEVENENRLKIHMKLFHSETSDIKFKCQKCNKTCSTYESLIEHHINSGYNEHCGICHERFESDPKLKEHEESVLNLSNNNLVSRSILARLTIFIVLIALILLREK